MVKQHSIQKDSDAPQENERFSHPIPSRHAILSYLQESGRPASQEQLEKAFDLQHEEELEGLRRRLIAMARDGQLLNTRRGDYALVKRLNLVRGRISGHRDGYGFVIADDPDDSDVYLQNREMNGVFHGDRVLVSFTEGKNGRREGVLVEVLERNTQRLVGRYFREADVGYVVPDSKHITQDIVIPHEHSADVEHGQIVLINIIEQPHKRRHAVGHVVKVLGEKHAPGMEIEMALHNYHLPHQWPEEVLSHIKTLPNTVTEADCADRKDLRHLAFVTIDGEDARDFDDAVYCEPRAKGGWRLWVAIADVAHYVNIGDALDCEGAERGNSVYFPSRVIPMLPEALSNELCSLKPKVDRLSLVCEMTIDDEGKITRSVFYNAVIHSNARLSYTNVAKMLKGDKKLRKQYAAIVDHVDHLFSLFQVLLKARETRGAIEFETVETRIIFGRDRKIESIVPVVRNDAHRIIEECMLAANVCAAKFLLRHKLPGLYRIHHGPNTEKLEQVRKFLGELGLRLEGGDEPLPKDYTRLIREIQDRPDLQLIQLVLLRSLSQAFYHSENEGHFGLAYEAYAHFTSPIRRYPDLITHRAIKFLLTHQPVSEFAYSADALIEVGAHCSMTERRADDATRDAMDWLKCEYMQDKVGSVFSGVISSVTGFGLFITLDDIYIDGLLHISNLDSDYYQFDATRHRLTGEQSGKVYRIGDKIEVLVARVNLDDKLIDFVPPESVNAPKKVNKPKKAKKFKKSTKT